jgi:hypothetical protein
MRITTFKTSIQVFTIIGLVGLLSSCSVSNYSMRQPNYRIDFQAEDFEFSDQVVAEATSVRVLGVDWKRLFKWGEGSITSDRFTAPSEHMGNVTVGSAVSNEVEGALLHGLLGIPSIPVIGATKKGRINAYALYSLMKENPGYDIVIYPQFEQKSFYVPFLYSKREVRVTARLGRISP